MKKAALALAAACLCAWAGAAGAQAESKPAPQPPARGEPSIKLRLDEADLRKLGPASSTDAPASAPPAEGGLPALGGSPASQETRTRLFDRGATSGPFPKDMNPNIR